MCIVAFHLNGGNFDYVIVNGRDEFMVSFSNVSEK